MNAVQAALIFATVTLVGVGPFVAVHLGGKAFDEEPEPDALTDDTIELPRIIVNDPYTH